MPYMNSVDALAVTRLDKTLRRPRGAATVAARDASAVAVVVPAAVFNRALYLAAKAARTLTLEIRAQ